MSDERAKRLPVPVIHTVGVCQCCRQGSECMCHVRAAEHNALLAENERLREEARSEYDANVKTSHELLAARDRIASLEQQVADLRGSKDYAITQAAMMLRILMDLGPWLSASLTEKSCAEYESVCNRVFEMVALAEKCVEGAAAKSQRADIEG